MEASLKDRLTGEMKFIRAFVYANLIWRYGGVPLITNVFELNQDFTVTRASYDECVDFIVKELDEAVRQYRELGILENAVLYCCGLPMAAMSACASSRCGRP